MKLPVKKFLAFCILFLFLFPIIARNKIDSLQNALISAKDDTTRVNTLNRIAEELAETNTSGSLEYAKQALYLSAKLNFNSGLISAHNNIGIAYYYTGSYPEALSNFIESAKILEKIGNKVRYGAVCNNIALIYLEQSKYEDAQAFFNKSLKVDLERGDKKGMADSYNNLGISYQDQENYEKAMEYYNLSLLCRKQANDVAGLPSTLTNLGMMYMHLKEFKLAKDHISEALALYKKNGDMMGVSLTYNDLGDICSSQDKYQNAIVYYDSSLSISTKNNLLSYISFSYESMAHSYAKLKDYEKAYNFHIKYMNVKDTIFNKDNADQLTEMQTKYETAKKEKEIILGRAESEKQSTMKNAFIIGFALMVIVSFVIFRGYRSKQHSNEIITLQKTEVEKQKLEVENQKEVIEEKSKEILDSIAYAKRIQETILPPDRIVKELLPQSFILYKPKDIVSGDFYWIEPWGDQVLFGAIDCTGHGVPGALMSVVGVNLLNKALNEFGLSKPNLILNSLSKGIGKTLRQTGADSEIKDGMDLALCSLDKKNNLLEYAGAFNPLWIIRDGELLEFHSDKNPIGSYLNGEFKNYTNHIIEVKKGDSIYIFTDGYADQFGGERGKKFKYKPLKNLLLSIHSNTMDEQLAILEKTFDEWKGDLEQVDDVLIIGVRIV